MRTATVSLLVGACLVQAAGALAADLDYGVLRGSDYEPVATIETESFTAEAFTGYQNTRAKEYAYNAASRNPRISELTWNSDALVVGGRLSYRATDWLTARARGWVSVDSRGSMTDYDFTGGYYGASSWTHYSQSPNTRISRAWQGDLSLSAAYYDDEGLRLTAIAGYRYFTTKWKALGGSAIYSQYAFRDTFLNFPNDQLGIAYRQTWETPYLGLGVSFTYDDWTATTELVGSPFAMAHARDHHALRSLLFTDNLGTTSMVGFNAGLEYRVTPMFSVVGRAEYQKYYTAKGSEKAFETATGSSTLYPSPSAGGSSESLLVSVGVKAHL